MTVKEWLDRLPDPKYIPGLVILTRYSLKADAPRQSADAEETEIESLDRIGEAIAMLDTNTAGDIILWSVPPATWPHGSVTITILPTEVLHAAFVLHHAGQDWAIYDGDIVRLRDWGVSQAYGFPPEVWVSATRNPDTGFFTGTLMEGDQQTDRLVRFQPSAIRAIKRLGTPS